MDVRLLDALIHAPDRARRAQRSWSAASAWILNAGTWNAGTPLNFAYSPLGDGRRETGVAGDTLCRR